VEPLANFLSLIPDDKILIAENNSPGKYFQYRSFRPRLAIRARLESVNFQALNSSSDLSCRKHKSSSMKIIRQLTSDDVNLGMAAGNAKANPTLELKFSYDLVKGN
jgi:hypothetical protein